MFKRAQWDRFSKHISKKYNLRIPKKRNLTITEVDSLLLKINEYIVDAIETCIPRFKPKDNTLNYVNNKITKSKLVTIIKQMKRQGYTDESPLVTRVRNVLNRMNEMLKSEFKCTYLKYWAKEHQAIDYKVADSFFPKINKFFRPKNSIDIQNLHTHDINLLTRCGIDPGGLEKVEGKYVVAEAEEKRKLMGAFYERVNSPRYTNIGTQTKQKVDTVMSNFKRIFENYRSQNKTILQFSENNPAHSPADTLIEGSPYFCKTQTIIKIFQKLPNKTSTGIDNIPPIVLKHMPLQLYIEYTALFNNALNHCYFPKRWKEVKILPIPKKGKEPHDPSSHRPLSLTPSIGKAYEIAWSPCLKFWTKRNKVIPNEQFGFENKHSTTHAVNKLTSDINKSLNNNLMVGACLIDLDKAFDSVWLDGLIYTLLETKYLFPLVLLIYDMITGRSFAIWDGTSLSEMIFLLLEGLGQGTVSSPPLFNIYTREVLTLKLENRYIKEHKLKVGRLAFADDFIVYISGRDPEIPGSPTIPSRAGLLKES